MNEQVAEAVILAERGLLDPAVRSDRGELERRLDREFIEIGQSGRLWTRDEIIADLLVTDQTAYARAELSEPQVRELAPNCYLLTSVVQVEGRRSRRASIWRRSDGHLRMVFNQGTSAGGS